MTDIGTILNERGSRYGSFDHNATTTQALKRVVHSAPEWKACNDLQKEAVEMICHKLSRIVCGDPDYADSWRDIEGYARLVSARLESPRKETT